MKTRPVVVFGWQRWRVCQTWEYEEDARNTCVPGWLVQVEGKGPIISYQIYSDSIRNVLYNQI
jgi:hypothetical protein